MNILVTGGAGFIGSHLVDELMIQDHIVTVIDDLSTGSLDNLAHWQNDPNLKFIRGSITDEILLSRVFCSSRFELVYHLAAVVGVHHVLKHPYHMLMSNIHGTELVLRNAHNAQARVVFASSSEIYGKAYEVLPLRENHDRILGSTTVPRWAYSTSKAVGEYIVHAYSALDLPTTIIRYCNVYGTRLDARGYGSVIAKFISQARAGEPLTVYGDGNQTRCFLYVDDAINGTVCAGTYPHAIGETFNLANPAPPVSMTELAEMVITLCKSTSKIQYVKPPYVNFEEPLHRMPSMQHAFNILEFQPRVAITDGLSTIIDILNRGYH